MIKFESNDFPITLENTFFKLWKLRTSESSLCVAWQIWVRIRRQNPSKIARSDGSTDDLIGHD